MNSTYRFTSPRTTSGLQLLYTFMEGVSNSSSTSSADVAGLNLLGDMLLKDPATASWSVGRPGVYLSGVGTTDRVVSSKNVSLLTQSLVSSGQFAVEVWFTPSSNNIGMIAGIGSWRPAEQAVPSCRTANKVNYDMGLTAASSVGGSVADTVGFTYVGGNGSPPRCTGFDAAPEPDFTPAFTNGQMLHYVFTANSTVFRVYINGAERVEKGNSVAPLSGFDFTVWNSSMHLYLGQPLAKTGASWVTQTWSGNIWLIAMYNKMLRSDEVVANFNAGVPRSIASVIVSNLSINVSGSGYNSLSTLGLSYTNVDVPSNVTFRIPVNGLPAFGCLSSTADSSGIITPAMLPFSFIPVSLFYSSCTNSSSSGAVTFLITVSIGGLIVSIPLAYNGFFDGPNVTVSLTVVAPAVLSNVSALTTAGLNKTLTLNATNNNMLSSPSTLSLWITSLPALGQLYQTSDGVHTGSLISTVPTLITSTQQQVIYVSTEVSCSGQVQIADVFEFRSSIQYYDVSAISIAYMNITLVNPLTAISASLSFQFDVDNNTQPQQIVLNGGDVFGRSLQFTLTQLPQSGRLYANTSVSSIITTVPYFVSANQVYYTVFPYPYSSGMTNETVTRNDWFGYVVSVIGSASLSPAANTSLSVTCLTIPDPTRMVSSSSTASSSSGSVLSSSPSSSSVLWSSTSSDSSSSSESSSPLMASNDTLSSSGSTGSMLDSSSGHSSSSDPSLSSSSFLITGTSSFITSSDSSSSSLSLTSDPLSSSSNFSALSSTDSASITLSVSSSSNDSSFVSSVDSSSAAQPNSSGSSAGPTGSSSGVPSSESTQLSSADTSVTSSLSSTDTSPTSNSSQHSSSSSVSGSSSSQSFSSSTGVSSSSEVSGSADVSSSAHVTSSSAGGFSSSSTGVSSSIDAVSSLSAESSPSSTGMSSSADGTISSSSQASASSSSAESSSSSTGILSSANGTSSSSLSSIGDSSSEYWSSGGASSSLDMPSSSSNVPFSPSTTTASSSSSGISSTADVSSSSFGTESSSVSSDVSLPPIVQSSSSSASLSLDSSSVFGVSSASSSSTLEQHSSWSSSSSADMSSSSGVETNLGVTSSLSSLLPNSSGSTGILSSSSSVYSSSSGLSESSSTDSTGPNSSMASSSTGSWFSSTAESSSTQPSTSSSTSATFGSSSSTSPLSSTATSSASSTALSGSTGSMVSCPVFPSCFVTLDSSCYSPFFTRVDHDLSLLFPFSEGQSNRSAGFAVDFSCRQVGTLQLGRESTQWVVTEPGVLFGTGPGRRLVPSFLFSDIWSSTAYVRAFSIELWLRPSSLTQAAEILSIVEPGTKAQLLVLQNQSNIDFSLFDPFENTSYNLTVTLPTRNQPAPYHANRFMHTMSLDAAVLTHFVLIVDGVSNSSLVFINGAVAANISTPVSIGNMVSWFAPNGILEFAKGGWNGSAELFAWYSQALTPSEVLQNYRAGLAPTLVQPVDTIPVVCSSPNTPFSVLLATNAQVLHAVITELPSSGVLSEYDPVFGNYTQIHVSSLPFILQRWNPAMFLFRKTSNTTASDTFKFALISSNAPKYMSNSAIAQLLISPSITPPRALDMLVNCTALLPSVIKLSGLDMDQSPPLYAAMTAAIIASLPDQGILYQYSSGGSPGDIMSLNSIVSDSELRVIYVPAEGNLGKSTERIVNSDTFTFHVVVKNTSSVTPGIVSVSVTNHLKSTNRVLTLFDNDDITFALQGVDLAGGTVQFVLTSNSVYGVLRSSSITVNTFDPFDGILTYSTNQNRFSGRYNRLLTPVPDSFTFAVQGSSGMLSEPSTVQIVFAPALGPPLLVIRAPWSLGAVSVGTKANFTALIDTTGLQDPLNTTWLVDVNVTPSNAFLLVNYSESETYDNSLNLLTRQSQRVQFSGQTFVCNTLLDLILFQSSVTGEYSVSITVSNALDSSISSQASQTITVINANIDSTSTSSDLLPFNTLWLWLAIGLLVGLIVVGVLVRRYWWKPRQTPRKELASANTTGELSLHPTTFNQTSSIVGDIPTMSPAHHQEPFTTQLNEENQATTGNEPTTIKKSLFSFMFRSKPDSPPLGGRRAATGRRSQELGLTSTTSLAMEAVVPIEAKAMKRTNFASRLLGTKVKLSLDKDPRMSKGLFTRSGKQSPRISPDNSFGADQSGVLDSDINFAQTRSLNATQSLNDVPPLQESHPAGEQSSAEDLVASTHNLSMLSSKSSSERGNTQHSNVTFQSKPSLSTSNSFGSGGGAAMAGNGFDQSSANMTHADAEWKQADEWGADIKSPRPQHTAGATQQVTHNRSASVHALAQRRTSHLIPVNPMIAPTTSTPRFDPTVYNMQTQSQEVLTRVPEQKPSLDATPIAESIAFSHTQPIPDMARVGQAGFSRTHPLLGDAIAQVNQNTRKAPLDEFRDDESELQQ